MFSGVFFIIPLTGQEDDSKAALRYLQCSYSGVYKYRFSFLNPQQWMSGFGGSHSFPNLPFFNNIQQSNRETSIIWEAHRPISLLSNFSGPEGIAATRQCWVLNEGHSPKSLSLDILSLTLALSVVLLLLSPQTCVIHSYISQVYPNSLGVVKRHSWKYMK